MPDLIEREPVEPFKLTKEHKAFMKSFKRVNEVSAMIQQGLRIQFGKLEAMQQIAQEVEGQKKELLLQAPNQSVYDSADEGMVKTQGAAPRGGMVQ